ncbi:peptide-binding protein [Thermoproteota archaeon]
MKHLILIFILLTLLVPAGCTQKTSVSPHNNTLKLRLAGEPSTLNPILSTDVYSGAIEGVLFNGLFRINENLDLEPDLAESYAVNKQGTIYTFHLRQNVRWHDGQPFTAEDVKFTFETILDPNTNTVRRSSFIINGKPVAFKIINTHTIQAILPEPFAPFLTRISMSIIPKHILKDQNINTTEFNRNPIGTGPFKFQLWKTGQYILTEKNTDYFGKTAHLDKIIFKLIPDTNTATIALEKGEIDVMDIMPKDLERMNKISHLNTFHYEQLQYSFIGFNLKHPMLSEPLIRQAIAHAVNRDAIIKNVYNGMAKPAFCPASPILWGYPKNVANYAYDPKKSNALLAQAGFVLNNKTGVFERDNQALEFTLISGKGSKPGEKTAQIIQQYLSSAGIKMNIQLMEWQSFIKILNNPSDPKPFDAAMLGWSLGIDPDSYSIWHSSQYPKGFNFIGYSNPRVDTLLVKGRSTISKPKRTRVYQELFSKIAEDIPYLFLIYPETITAVNTRVKGLSKPGPAGLFVRIEDIKVLPR